MAHGGYYSTLEEKGQAFGMAAVARIIRRTHYVGDIVRDLRRAFNQQPGYASASVFGSTGRPAACQAAQPPTRATAFG